MLLRHGLLLLLLGVGLCIPGGSHGAFHQGFKYDYYYEAETEIMGMDNMTTQMQLTLTPVQTPDERNDTMVEMTIRQVIQFSQLHPEPRTMAKDKSSLPFYMAVDGSGLVLEVLSNHKETDDILVLKKSVAATFSHSQQVHEGDEWSYETTEQDHMGDALHTYDGERTRLGYNLKRSHRRDDDYQRIHSRHIKLDGSGHVHAVDDREEIIVHEDPDDPILVRIDGGQEGEVAQPQAAREPKLRSTSKLRFQDKRSIQHVPIVSDAELSLLRRSGLNMMEIGWRKDTPGDKIFPRMKRLLLCTNKYKRSDRRRVDCLSDLMQLAYHVNQDELYRWGHNFLLKRCVQPTRKDEENTPETACTKSRRTLIAVLGQAKSAQTQRLLVKDVVNREPVDEEELKQVIFHLGVQDTPTKETFDALVQLCFGKDGQHYAQHNLSGNRGRACLSLGSILLVYHDKDDVDAVVEKLHSWFEADMDKAKSLVDIGYHDLRENVERSQFIHGKHLLLEVLSNAAHPRSRDLFLQYGAPNHGHGGWRHAALSALRKYHDQHSATALLNSTVNDDHYNVRVMALRHYKEHPLGMNFQQDDAVILDSHGVKVSGGHSLSKRSTQYSIMCNLLEKLTLDKEFAIPGIDWNKKVGNSMFGADFGIKMVNRMHLHLSPVAGFFEVESVNSAWITVKVKMVIKFHEDLFRAETCYQGDIRLWNISFVKDYAQEQMGEYAGMLDHDLEHYADLMANSINAFNDLLGEWDIPELGLFDLDTSSPRAFIKSLKDGIKKATNMDWKEWAINATLGILEKNGMDSEKFRGIFSNTKEWAKERFTEVMEENFEEQWAKLQESVDKVKEILNKDLGEIEFPLEILDKALSNMTLKDLIEDPDKFGKELVQKIKDEIKDWGQKQEFGLMGNINRIVNATRELPNKLNELRQKVEDFKDELLDIEALDWAKKAKKIVERLRYYIEEDSLNILNFFQDIADENGITLPFVSQLLESANKFMAVATKALSMSPQQAMQDISRAVRQMKTSLAMFANAREKLAETKSDLVGKLDSFMKLGSELKDIKKDLAESIGEVRQVIGSLRSTLSSRMTAEEETDRYGIRTNGRALAEKVVLKIDEVVPAEKTLKFLEAIQDSVFSLDYLADNYQDGFDRVIQALEVAKERFEDIKKNVGESKEFVFEVFGIKFHPNFPNLVRDECDEVCECGMYPSHMYGRVGVQLMADEGEPIVCPVDGYVLVGKEHPDELIVRPVDEELEEFEMTINHITPDDFVLDIDEDEEAYGQLMTAGQVMGYGTKAPCAPNFIFVSQRERTAEETPPDGTEPPDGTTPPDATTTPEPPSESECGATKDAHDSAWFAPVEEYSGKAFPMPKWVTHCAHKKFEHIKMRAFDLSYFADKFNDIMEKLERMDLDMAKKILNKAASAFPNWPDILNPAAMEKMKKDTEKKISKFPKKATRFMEEKIFGKTYKWVDGLKIPELTFPDLDLKFPEITDYLDINNMKIQGLMDSLIDMDLEDKADQLMDMSQKLSEKMHEKIMDNPLKKNPAEIRSALQDLGVKLDGLDLDKAVLKFYEKIKECGSGLILGQGSICDAPPGCAEMICSIKAEIGHFIERMNFTFHHDQCARNIYMSINGHEFNVSYKDTKNGSLTKTFDFSKGMNTGSLEVKAAYALNEEGNVLSFSLSLTPCVTTPFLSKCAASKDFMKEYELPVYIEIDGTECSFAAPPAPTKAPFSGLTDVLNSKVKDFMYALDRFGQNKSDLTQLIDEMRTTAVQSLLEKTGLNSSIDGNEIHNPQDLETNEKKPLMEVDITFFRLPFKFPVPPMVFKVEVGAGGVVGVNFACDIRVLSSVTSLTLDPWIGAKAWGEGAATCVGMGGGVKLTGYLLETHFPFTIIYNYEQYPIVITKKLDSELIPLRCKFEGYIQFTRFIKIKFTIFDWSAAKITGNIFTKYKYIDDDSPPEYVGDYPPEEEGYRVGRSKRSVDPHTCHVEQVQGRHPTDAAFLLNAPIHDEDSPVEMKYCIGTHKGGKDVLDWQKMEGPTLTNAIQLKETGRRLHFTVVGKNTQGLELVIQCSIQTYDVTLPSGRMEANYIKTSHPRKISSSMVVIDDSELVKEQFVAVGVGEHYYGHSVVDWHHFEMEKNPINKDATGPLGHFATARVGKLTSEPFQSNKQRHDYECAQACLDFGEKCVSFDYEYVTENCDLQSVIEGPAVHLRVSESYRNFERLSAGHSAWFSYENLELIHGEVYYINARITNNLAYMNYLTSPGGIIVDFTPPEPGPIGDAAVDILKNDGCSASFNHADRCVDVTDQNNHRMIVDGPGAATVFNGNRPKADTLYTISNHYLCGNWDGFHDNETDLWAYTWAAGQRVCDNDVVAFEDPHSHLADRSYWNHQGYASGLVLEMGKYYVTVQSLNDIVHGGALVTSVCHHIPLVIDLTPPVLHIVDDVFFDEDFDIMAIYYQAYDLESGIMRTDFGLGETMHDVFVRSYTRHDPTWDGYEMITVDDVDLPHGIPLWVRVRPVNNVELLTAGHGDQPIMIDTSPPVAGDVLDGDQLYDLDYQPYDHRMCAQWLRWFDPESGINSYMWAIGSAPDLTVPDVMDWRTYDHWHRSDCVEIALNHSQTYYNYVRAFNQALNSRSTNKSSDGVMVDMTDPVAGVVNDGYEQPDDIQFSADTASVYTYWTDFYDPESGIVGYHITINVNDEDVKTIEKKSAYDQMEDHTLHLLHNDFVKVTVEATDGATRTNSSESSGFRIDTTAPEVRFLRDSDHGYKYTSKDDEMYATWKFQDVESGIYEYRVLIYQHEGGTVERIWPKSSKWEVFDPNEDNDNIVETTVTGLKLKNGRKYSVEVTAVNGAQLGSKHESPGVIVDTTPPVIQNVFVGFYGADESLNDDEEVIQADPDIVHASWQGYDHESGVLSFMVAVGKYPGDTSVTNGFIDYGSELSGYLRELALNVTDETGDLYYVTVKAMNGAGAWSDTVSSRPIHVYGANTPGTVSDGRKEDEDATYQQDITSVAITFSGFESPACGIRAYEWAVGSEPGWSDILPYSSVGIVMLNDSHSHAQAHLQLHHDELMYASVRAHTGHACHEDIIHSSSDGSTVDIEPPALLITTLGLYGMENETEEILAALRSDQPLYQEQYDAIDFRWNATDLTSDVANMTWMAGGLPVMDDAHVETDTIDSQIPMMSVSMQQGQTLIFTVQARDFAGNTATMITPPLTIDTTPPLIIGLTCNKYLSRARSLLACDWEGTVDPESPIRMVQIGLGSEQRLGDVVTFYDVTLTERSWSVMLSEDIFSRFNGTYVVSLMAENVLGQRSGAYVEVVLDITPPEVGDAFIMTTERVGETPEKRVCQRSTGTMAIDFEGFFDPESDIESYEVGIGSYEGGADIRPFEAVTGRSVVLDTMSLVPGEMAYATVKAINKAGLHSGVASSSVYVSPYPDVIVLDGLDEEDKDFQNDPSSISGQVFLSQHCPIIYGIWSIHDIQGNVIMEDTEFFNGHFANDELRLENMQTFFVTVEIMDSLNRTFRGRSNGVTIYIQPPDPGAVRDGPHQGEDRHYQQSTSEYAVNWDDFGNDDEPGQKILRYEVALGDNPAYSKTRSNTHFFVDVGLEKNYTFTDLRLVSKSVKYYATVRGYAESGAYTESTSNGMKVGYTPGMLPGSLELKPYSNSSSVLSLSWSGFWSDFRIMHYHWGISSDPLPDSNVTVPCRTYLPEIADHFDALKLQDAKENSYVKKRAMQLHHGSLYYVTVIAEDEPGQCIAAPSESFLVDLTVPVLGEITITGIAKQVQYITNPEELHVSWVGFHDPESDIRDFYLQLFVGDPCNEGEIGDDHHFVPLSDVRDVQNDTEITFYDYLFQEGRPYRVGIQVVNHAGSESLMWSQPAFVDTSPPVRGHVKDGWDWKTSALYSPYTDKVFGTVAISPLGTGLYCRTQRNLISSTESFPDVWTVLADLDIYIRKTDRRKLVEYQAWNVKVEAEDEDVRADVKLLFHRNISLPNMEGGGIISEPVAVHAGKFGVQLQASRGHNTILSVTFSEGELDDYTSFEMVNYTDFMPVDDFDKIAQESDIDWDKQPDNDTDAITTESPWLTPPPERNATGDGTIRNPTDVHATNGFGLHFVGHSFGSDNIKVWFVLLWVRVDRTVMEEWVLLDEDPSEKQHLYELDLRQDESTSDGVWNMALYVDGIFKTELTGLVLPPELSVKIRNWNYENYLPPITDPFQPFRTESMIKDVLVPLPRDSMCHYGDAFYDMDSGVEEIYIGLGNLTEYEDNLVPYHKVATLCHPCLYRCDYYKCQTNCTLIEELVQGYYVMHLEMGSLNLHPGDHKLLLGEDDDGTPFQDNAYDDEFDDLANQTFFDNIRYHFLVKVINEAGLVTYSSSPGIRLDPTPPVPLRIVAVDPEFDMTLPATHQGHLDSLAAWWDFDEVESEIVEFKVAVGLSPNGTELQAWTSVGLARELLLDNLQLEEHRIYYFTVEATNAAGLKSVGHTDGITVRLGAPNVDNATVSMPGVDPGDTVEGEDGEKIFFLPFDNRLSLAIGGKMPDDAVFIEWGVGLSDNDTFLMRPIAVDRSDAELMEIRDGMFWYNGVITKYSLREAGVRTMAESNATDNLNLRDPGVLRLEPGTCVYHHVNSMNLAHQKTHIPVPPTCVKGPDDQRIELGKGVFDITFSRGDSQGSIKAKGVAGNLAISPLNQVDLEETYEISSNISYIPAVVNPDTTKNYTSRVLYNRLLENTGRGLVLSPTSTAVMDGPIEVTMSFANVPIQPGQPIAIIYWDRVDCMWRHSVESCGMDEQVDFNAQLITGSICGEDLANGARARRSTGNFALDHMLLVLHTIDEQFYNTPPRLAVHETTTLPFTLLEEQLMYEDDEDDDVDFSLASSSQHTGNASVSDEGMLTYMSEPWYFGVDILAITLTEINLPPVISPHTVTESFDVHIIEPAVAPRLFLETENSLDEDDDFTPTVSIPNHDHYSDYSILGRRVAGEDDGAISALRSGSVVLGFEGNTTEKAVGILHLCDVNKQDALELLIMNDEENLTYSLTEVTGKVKVNDDDEDMVSMCLKTNIRSFRLTANSSLDYHGSDTVRVIGHDDSVLYSQPLVLSVHTMISPCGVYGHCEGGEEDPACRSTQRAESYAGYGCACDRGYKGEYCTKSHLLPFEIVLIVAATASLVGASIFMAVKRYRRVVKVHPAPDTPEEIPMKEEESEYEEDTSSETEDEEAIKTTRDVEIEFGDGEAALRYQDGLRKEARNQALHALGGVEGDFGMAEIDI